MTKYTQKRCRRHINRRNKRKTKHSGGGHSGQSTTAAAVSIQSYPLNDGASSPRESSYIAGQNAAARHQSMIDTHGGGKRFKRKTRRYRNTLRKTPKRNNKHMRGGTNLSRTTTDVQPIVVPSFNTRNSISPVNPTSLSQSANTLNMQSSANSANDCYATGTCLPQVT
jgi:hypothetical protein